MSLQIGVVGGGVVDEGAAEQAYLVGKAVAEADALLVCGGLGGVMEAASRGASDANGTVVGILPGESKEDANPFVDAAVVTAMDHARNAVVARSSDALVAVDGSLGTLSEVALGLKMGKPVVAVEADSEIREALQALEEENLHFADTPTEAVEAATALASSDSYYSN